MIQGKVVRAARFNHTPSRTILALPAGLLPPSRSIRTASRHIGRKSVRPRAPRFAPYVLDGHPVDERDIHEIVYARGRSSRRHAEAP